MRRWSEEFQAPRNEVRLARLDLVDGQRESLPPGLYYLELNAPQVKARNAEYRPSRYMFVKSQLNLTLKQTRSEAWSGPRTWPAASRWPVCLSRCTRSPDQLEPVASRTPTGCCWSRICR